MPVNIIETETFEELRRENAYYVDKTGFLQQFLQDPTDASRFRAPSKATLFTRPRRFGKTLFMSMLAEFFDITKDSRDLFAGLAVSANEKLCKEWMNQYPVISLTLKGVDMPTYAEALESIQEIVSGICFQHRALQESPALDEEEREVLKTLRRKEAGKTTLGNSLFILTRAMYCQYNKPVIVLIDEYDVPVAKAAERGYYDEMILFMRSFLSNALKTNPYLKFAILTGALRITKESIFTGLNNLKCFDIANTAKYMDVFGFTQKEVDKLLACAGLEEKRDTIREWYDGYHIGNRSDIYCPWSIMQYVSDLQDNPHLEPQAYWVGTSANELPRDFVKRLPEDADVQGKVAALLGGGSIAVELNPYMNYVDVCKSADNFWTLLYLTGYLTLARNPELYQGEKDAMDSILAIPNREVRAVFQAELKAWLAQILPDRGRESLYKALWAQDVQELEQQLTALLVGSSFYDAKEAYYHGMLYGMLVMKYGDITSNGESGLGRYDIVVQDKANARAAVLEVKRITSAEQVDAGVRLALKQIAEQGYDVRLRKDNYQTILHVGIAFFQKTVKVGFANVSAGSARQ